MQVSVLVILCCGKEHITLHEDDDRAWSELVTFVDSSWESHRNTAGTSPPASEDERIKRFFAAHTTSYILGSADVSSIEAHVDTLDRG